MEGYCDDPVFDQARQRLLQSMSAQERALLEQRDLPAEEINKHPDNRPVVYEESMFSDGTLPYTLENAKHDPHYQPGKYASLVKEARLKDPKEPSKL